MPISTQEATQALGEISLAERRATVLRGYERGAPFFLLWGLIWIVGFSFTDAMPQNADLAWLILEVIGVTGSYLIGRAACARSLSACKGYGYRFTALGATLLAFIVATYFIMKPNSPEQLGAFPAIVASAVYVGVGIWRGVRWAVSGVILGALTVLGFAFFKEHFNLWMAAAGGGVMLLTGFWLRRA